VKLREFPLLADENIHPVVIDWLRNQGLDVLTVHEANLAAADDQNVLQLAYTQRRVVVTHDSDFGTLAVLGQEPFVGINAARRPRSAPLGSSTFGIPTHPALV
jgi:predicted nuclease of predicted toxin-antitoxin system